jgi:hypothetical protein
MGAAGEHTRAGYDKYGETLRRVKDRHLYLLFCVLSGRKAGKYGDAMRSGWVFHYRAVCAFTEKYE